MFLLGGSTNTSLYKWLHNASQFTRGSVWGQEGEAIHTQISKHWGKKIMKDQQNKHTIKYTSINAHNRQVNTTNCQTVQWDGTSTVGIMRENNGEKCVLLKIQWILKRRHLMLVKQSNTDQPLCFGTKTWACHSQHQLWLHWSFLKASQRVVSVS